MSAHRFPVDGRSLQAPDTYLSSCPEDTMNLASELLRARPGRCIIALHGDLGAGKTCFVRGLARELGISQPITSPTFTIVQEYPSQRPLYHIDLYRLADPDEMLDLGFDEYLTQAAVVAIEWAERAGDLLPEDTVHVTLEPGDEDDQRRITIEPNPPR